VSAQYLLCLPKEFGKISERRWPVLLFLHGSGERGTDLDLVKRHGPPKLIEEGQDFDFIVVSPQCPQNEDWSVDVLDALLGEIIQTYTVDEDRIYLTGLSMGDRGVWDFAIAYPGRFAAIAPICGRVGRNNLEKACRLRHLPTWVFHGAKDSVVLLSESETMVKALQHCGASVKFTVYPGAGHDSWTETYNNPDLYRWFLEQKR